MGIESMGQANLDWLEGMEWNGKNGYNKINGLYYPYDVLGIPHIGIGHKNVEGYIGLTQNEIYSLFYEDVEKAMEGLKSRLGEIVFNGLNKNQLSAFVSFIFNTGNYNSDLFKYYEQGDILNMNHFWVTHYLQDGILLERRKKEQEKFNEPYYETAGYSGGGVAVLYIFIFAVLYIFRKSLY